MLIVDRVLSNCALFDDKLFRLFQVFVIRYRVNLTHPVFHFFVLAEETEDDEVAGAVWYTDLPEVPEDKVPSLTDKTFKPTLEENDLLVVKFFQPCTYVFYGSIV